MVLFNTPLKFNFTVPGWWRMFMVFFYLDGDHCLVECFKGCPILSFLVYFDPLNYSWLIFSYCNLPIHQNLTLILQLHLTWLVNYCTCNNKLHWLTEWFHESPSDILSGLLSSGRPHTFTITMRLLDHDLNLKICFLFEPNFSHLLFLFDSKFRDHPKWRQINNHLDDLTTSLWNL